MTWRVRARRACLARFRRIRFTTPGGLRISEPFAASLEPDATAPGAGHRIFTLDRDAEDRTSDLPAGRSVLREPVTMNLAETILDGQARAEEARGEFKVWRRQIQIAACGDENWAIWADHLELAEHGRRHPRLPASSARWRDEVVLSSSGGTEYAFPHFKTWEKTALLPFVAQPGAAPSSFVYVRAHAAATAALRRRSAWHRRTTGLLAPWRRLSS